MEKSWNVMEFGFENCVGTLSKDWDSSLDSNENFSETLWPSG